MKIVFSVAMIALLPLFPACGQILDGGPIPESTYPNIRIQFADEQNGWIIGPRIQTTRDGGRTWSSLETKENEAFILASEGPDPVRYFFQYIDRDGGWRISKFPHQHSVQYTEDGGYSWSTPIKVADRLYPSALMFVSPEKGWVLGFEKVFLTHDRGKSWNKEHRLEKLSLYYPFALNQNHVWFASSYGVLAGTADGGKNWAIHNNLPKGAMCIYFNNPLNGWVIGREGLVAQTKDGGESWHIQNVPIPLGSGNQKATLLDIFFLNSEIGWMVGHDGLVLYTTDGGKTWTRGSTPIRSPLGSVRFIDQLRGWAVGGNAKPVFPTGRPSNVVIKTTDGGKSWTLTHH